MKYAVLKALVTKLQNETKLLRTVRVADSVLKVEFDKNGVYYFDLTRGHNFVFKKERFPPKNYHAPFDAALAKQFTRSNIDKIELMSDDKIIRIYSAVKLGYKEQKSSLILEMTGKSANAVIVDEKETVLSALRYEVGARELRIGQRYAPPPPPPFKFSDIDIGDVDAYLEELLESKQKNRLENLKAQKVAQIDKKIEKLEELLASFEEPSNLNEKADEALKIGDLLCANAHLIASYQKSVTLDDFDGNKTTIELPEAKSQKEILNFFYQKAKKLRKKADGIYKEKESVGEKLSFLKAQRSAVLSAKDEEVVKLFTQKPKKEDKKEDGGDIFEVFYKEYKISVGKNRKGNEKLLKFARANDLWFHIKDMPSAHAILHTDRQAVSDDALLFAAKVCVELSVEAAGSYLVDYARRRDVSPVEGAKVNYVNYKTLTVKKD
jgi:predicted ribosome quality control (RQC) complex YloA/Tae2 family protein